MRDACNERCVGVTMRISAVQSVDIGEQHQAIGADHLRDTGREAVIVAVTNLSRSHRIVLVDHRNRTEPQQGLERGPRIEVARALLAVLKR